MSDTDETKRPGKTLSLKKTETSTVKQSFSHGRTKAAIAKAVEKKLFARAAKAQVSATADLAERVEKALVNRMTGDLGLARRSGQMLLGFDNVLRGLESH